MAIVEKFTRRGEIRRIKGGLISAITAVNLRKEGKDPSDYESSGKKILEDLANPQSLIHQINTSLMKNHKETIEKAKSTYPTFESRNYLLELLETV